MCFYPDIAEDASEVPRRDIPSTTTTVSNSDEKVKEVGELPPKPA